MKFFGAGEYATKIPKLLAAEEDMDIIWDSGDSFVERVRSKAYYDISKDLKNYPALKELFPDEFLSGVTIDGGIYGIPTLKEMANNWAVYIDRDTLNSLGKTEDDFKTIYDIEPLIKACTTSGRLGFRIGKEGEHVAFGRDINYDVISGPFVISNSKDIAPNQKNVVNFFETEDFDKYVRLLRDWYQKGYIMSDVLENGTSTYTSKVDANQDMQGVIYVCYSPLNEVAQSKVAGKEMVPVQLTTPVIGTQSTRGSIMAIYNKSKDPQSALKFLELLNTDKEVNRLVKYGIEGKHYNMVKDEDGVEKIEKVENANTMYLNQNWRSGNMLLGNLEVGEDKDKVKIFTEWNDNAERSDVAGFTPDTSSVAAEYSACVSVVSEKVNPLLTGAIDPDDPKNGIAAVKAAMKTAGSEKVVQLIQTQYVKWLASK